MLFSGDICAGGNASYEQKGAIKMRKFWKCYFAAFLCMLMMCGCGKNHTNSVFEVVTSVDIVTQRDGQLLRRHYTAQEKMRPVLLYLRMLKHSPLSEPITEPAGEDVFLISGRQKW